ncbi:phosphotransferase [Blastococcus sp. Marseille-P5729]|uniref:maltokinase N-terminal cap-like domain-containing protein n=1 Tax=Blastococcus sp. Marseille-P5729 TaxID=2086582 RepID=UPI000D0E62FE|nr:phosphotransferase [Blastococcus sp. Marseille-P5729]
MRTPPGDHLARWLLRQRWYAGRDKAVPHTALSMVGAPYEHDGLSVALAVVTAGDGPATERYFVPIAHAAGHGLASDPIYTGDAEWFDAFAHPASARVAIELLGRSTSAVQATWLDEAPLDLTGLTAAAGEQSNSSLLTGQHVIKVLRRMQPGPNPEVEVGQALRSSTSVATLCGFSQLADGPTDVLVVHRRIAGADGFTLAVADADRQAVGEVEQHFPGAAYELGITLGAVHSDLVTAFGEESSASYGPELSRRLLRRLDALADLDVLQPYLSSAAAIFGDLARVQRPLTVHRVHGDLHLGQSLFTDDGWRLIDFEGEPRRPLEERRAPESPLRDLAGMLRSFGYAARWSRRPGGSGGWEHAARRMLLEGYRLQRPDAVDEQVLEALELDKALYEVGYENAYRPDRVRIPLSAVAALAGRG